MDKKEYLKNRFKRDFLQYSLLQEDSLSAIEIAEKLYGVIDFNWLINQCKQEIESLCNKHLSFEKVKVDGKLSNELSQELGYDLKDRILTEYQNYLDSHSTDKITTAIISKIVKSVELQTWSNGIVNMQKAIKLLVERLNNSSRSYGNLYTAPISENDILEKFNKAKENTLLERIQGNNIDDIIEYRSALMEYVRVSCENMLYAKLKEVYANIAIDATFKRLQSNFNGLSQYAQELKSSIADCEANDEWDKEYNCLVPTDFYYRNVENITAEHAFHMILLQFFAKNEEWMTNNGLLVNGELKVYASFKVANIREILNRIKDKNNIVIVNKIDLENKLNLNELPSYIEMSIKDDIGINELRNKIKEMFNLEQIEQNDYTYLSSARSISLLKKSLESLDAVRCGIENNMPVDMVEIDLKQMWSTLGEIIGETYTDELIDQLFSQFCLGK